MMPVSGTLGPNRNQSQDDLLPAVKGGLVGKNKIIQTRKNRFKE
jgi:hypothetical protein